MNKKNVLITIFTSGIAFVIGYLINFFLTPYITDNIGTAAYGYVTLAKTVASYAVIATTALNSYAARYIAIAYHKKDYELANKYFNSVLFSDFLIGVVIVLICIILMPYWGNIFGIEDNLIADVSYLFLLIGINLFVNLSGTAFQAAAIIKDKLLILSFCKIISYFAEGLVLIFLYSNFVPRVFYVAIGIILATITLVLANIYITKKYTSEIIIRVSHFDIHAVRTLVINGLWNSLNSLGNTLNSGLDIIVSNALLGAVAMGQVSIVKTMNTVFSSIFQMTSQPFEPTFLRNYAENNKTELISSLKYSMKLSGMLSNVVFAGVASLGLCYYKLWIPNQNYVLLYRLTVIAVLSSLFEGAISPMYYIYTLTVKNKIPCIITILGGIFNVIGMYALIQNTNLGIYAIFLTTAVVMLLINGVSNPIYMCRCLKIPWYTFYPTLIRHVISCFIMTGLMMILTHILNPSTWIDFIACGVLYVILGMIVHIMVLFNLSELRKATKKFITIFVDKIHI